MDISKNAPKSIDEYIEGFSGDIKSRLKKIRATIRKAAPKAEEKISYGMPAFHLNGSLVYFAGNKKHIGIYPTSSVIEESIKEAAQYRTGKGTLQFKNDEPLPLDLIRKIVEYRATENLSKLGKNKS